MKEYSDAELSIHDALKVTAQLHFAAVSVNMSVNGCFDLYAFLIPSNLQIGTEIFSLPTCGMEQTDSTESVMDHHASCRFILC